MDPNGTYAPASSSGTYVLCNSTSGGVKLTYWEGPVFAESGTAVWDTSTHEIQDIGPEHLPSCQILTSNGSDGTGLKSGTRYFHCTNT